MRMLQRAAEFWCVASPRQVDHFVPQVFEYSDRGFELRQFGEGGGKRTLVLAEATACFHGSLVAKIVLAVESKKSLQQKESDSCQTTGAVKDVSLSGEPVRMKQGKF